MPFITEGKTNIRYILIVVVLAAIVGGGILGYQYLWTPKEGTTPLEVKAPEVSPEKIVEEGIITWPKVNLSNSVIFISPKYILNIGTPDGKNIRPLHQEITQNFKSISLPSDRVVSPGQNEFFFRPSENEYYITSLDGKILKKIDIEKIKNSFGNQYEVSVWGWSSDSKKLVIWLRDIKNFLDDLCCEGGDFRTSKQIIAEYDIETSKIRELYSKTAPPLDFLFYDPIKGILVYTEINVGGVKRNLSTGEEMAFDAPSIINQEGTGEFFIDWEMGRRMLKIYSIYEPTELLTQIELDEPENKHYTNWLVWSPKNSYFAILVLDKDKTGGSILKIYNRSGKIILSTNFSLGDAVFSNDEQYLLSSLYLWDQAIAGVDVDKTLWHTIEVTTGDKYIEPVISADLGTPIFWLK